MPRLALIVAYSVPGRVIGDRGKIPWRHPVDQRHFKTTTIGHAVIMGRLSWDALGRPLPGRRNLVLTRDPAWSAPGAERFADLDAGIAAARAGGDECPFVIGGGVIYALAFAGGQLSDLYLTEVHEAVSGDAFFPTFDEAPWREAKRDTIGPLIFRHLVRP